MSESGEKTRKGLVWMLLSGVGSQVVILVTNLVILRFLDRSVLGEAMNAADVVLLLNAASSLGLGQFVVVKTRDRADLAFHAAVLFISVGAVVFGAALAFPNVLGGWFKSPEMGRYIPGLVIAGMIDRIGVVPERILVRDQNFRSVALSRGLGEMTYGVTSLAIAAVTQSSMAVVYAGLLRSFLRTGIFLRSAGLKSWLTPVRLERKKFFEALGFGVPLSVASSALMVSRKLDNLLISRFFGPAISQEYRTAYNYAETPGGFISDAVIDVVLSSFVREDKSTRGKAFVRAAGILAAGAPRRGHQAGHEQLAARADGEPVVVGLVRPAEVQRVGVHGGAPRATPHRQVDDAVRVAVDLCAERGAELQGRGDRGAEGRAQGDERQQQHGLSPRAAYRPWSPEP